jgi:FAD dependent oxidoreductase
VPDYDVVIVGGSFGGCAAALAAAAGKARVVLLEANDWVGGQATSQGVTRWDEAAADLTEWTGSPASYRRLRDRIRGWYGEEERSDYGRRQTYFNPGFACVGPPFTEMPHPPKFVGEERRGHPFAADPTVVHAVLDDLLNAAGVTVVRGAAVQRAEVADGTVHSVTVRVGKQTDVYTGRVFLDATDLGDLLVHCGVPFVIGAEASDDTQEEDTPDVAHPEWIQPCTVPIAVEWSMSESPDATAMPSDYEQIRKRQGFDRLMRPTGNPQHPQEGDGGITVVFNAGQEGDTMINYRQFIDPENFNDRPAYRTTINVGSNDYLAEAIPSNSHTVQQDTAIVDAAKSVSRAYVYYLQHDCPRHPGSAQRGFPEIKIDRATFGTADGTALAPYIRESRRIRSPHTRVLRKHIEAKLHGGKFDRNNPVNTDPPGLGSRSQRATNFKDSCGIGWYAADVHKGYYSLSGQIGDAEPPYIGTPWNGFGTVPFQVPLGALLPQGFTNFVASCKNIGTTHLTSGAYRVHPVEWAIGEAAGTLAAYGIAQKLSPGVVVADRNHVMAYQMHLLANGAPIFWWDDVPYENNHQRFAAIQALGAWEVFEGDGLTRNFDPTGPCPSDQWPDLERRLGRHIEWPANPKNRADTAVWICKQLKLL